MLALVYIVLAAKPISIRRLFMLYAFLLVLAYVLLGAFHVRNAAGSAMAFAVVITLLVWVSPPVRAIYGSLLAQRAPMEAFVDVSTCVQWTYGFALVSLPIIAARIATSATHRFTTVILLEALLAASVAGLCLPIFVEAQSRRIRRPKIPTKPLPVPCERCSHHSSDSLRLGSYPDYIPAGR